MIVEEIEACNEASIIENTEHDHEASQAPCAGNQVLSKPLSSSMHVQEKQHVALDIHFNTKSISNFAFIAADDSIKKKTCRNNFECFVRSC